MKSNRNATDVTPVIEKALRAAGFRRKDVSTVLRVKSKSNNAYWGVVQDRVYFLARSFMSHGEGYLVLVDAEGRRINIPSVVYADLFC